MKNEGEGLKILITGVNGYIGSHVAGILSDRGYRVSGADVDFGNVDERVEQIAVPIFSGDKHLYEQLGGPDICIHLAWRKGFVHDDEIHLMDLPDHYIFLKNMMELGLKRLVVMGTVHEIGYWEGAVTDSTPANPVSLYGIAKNALRQMVYLAAEHTGTKVDWLRAYYIIGDDERNHSVFTKIAEQEKAGKETFPFTSGKNRYDFIGIEELAEQIAAVAGQDEIHGIINCCSGRPVALYEKVEAFIKDNGYKIRPEYGAFPDRRYDSPAIWGDAGKIARIMERKR